MKQTDKREISVDQWSERSLTMKTQSTGKQKNDDQTFQNMQITCTSNILCLGHSET